MYVGTQSAYTILVGNHMGTLHRYKDNNIVDILGIDHKVQEQLRKP
jgi:hypothetical protein